MVREYQVGQTIGEGDTGQVYTVKLTDRKTTAEKLKGKTAKYRVKIDLSFDSSL